MVILYKQEHNGVTYWNYYGNTKNKGIITIDNKRISLVGTFKIVLTQGSYKFNQELQFMIFNDKTNKYEVESRNISKWNTTETIIQNITPEKLSEIRQAIELFEFILKNPNSELLKNNTLEK